MNYNATGAAGAVGVGGRYSVDFDAERDPHSSSHVVQGQHQQAQAAAHAIENTGPRATIFARVRPTVALERGSKKALAGALQQIAIANA